MSVRESPSLDQRGERCSDDTVLTETQARLLLSERGYHLVKRVQHIHASRGEHEWHVCLLSEVPSLTPEQFLHRFEEARGFGSASLERGSGDWWR